jgi:hypothetical protein
MERKLTPYVPGKRSYPPLSAELRESLAAIVPSNDGELQYHPCSVTLKNGTAVPCVYVVAAQSYINIWGVWPEDDPAKRHISISEIVSLAESPFRLPPHFAAQLYAAGESGMGYSIFTLVFRDGSEQTCLSGNAIDFVHLPVGKTMSDISGVIPHKRRSANYVEAPVYHWCLFGEGESRVKSRRFEMLGNFRTGLWLNCLRRVGPRRR